MVGELFPLIAVFDEKVNQELLVFIGPMFFLLIRLFMTLFTILLKKEPLLLLRIWIFKKWVGLNIFSGFYLIAMDLKFFLTVQSWFLAYLLGWVFGHNFMIKF